MERKIWIREGYCAVEEDGRLVEYLPVSAQEQTGDILRGRVERIMASLQCAFVDIGRKKNGFLPLKENSLTFQGGALRSGDEVWVQIRKEETGEKGAFLSRDLCLAGSGLILMPMNRFTGVSARIRDPEQRERLNEIGRSLAGEGWGIVMRSAALGMEKETLCAECGALKEKWQCALERAAKHPEERLLVPGNSVAEELMLDYGPRGIDAVIRNEDLTPDLERQRKEAENRKVRLPHGGNLVIDRCEALTVIDVNSASDDRGRSRRETILETNLEACREIAVQTRLRNLSGILILDLIDMDREEDRQRMLDALSEAFAGDRIKTVIHGMTRLGLVEMTRKRSRAANGKQAEREEDGRCETQST